MVTSSADLTSRSADEKPWLRLYGERPIELASPFGDMLSMWRSAVRQWPDRVAIRYFDRAFTYLELDRLSDRLAIDLKRRGLARGDRMAIVAQNIPQLPIAIFACWKLGGTPMPCNPMYSERELTLLFEDASPQVIICQVENLEVTRAAAAGARLDPEVVIGTCAATWQDRNDRRVLPPASVTDVLAASIRMEAAGAALPHIELEPEEAGLLMYTSGTTGLPKGAVLSHRSLSFNTETARVWFHLPDACVMLTMAPLFHITGFELNLCTALAVGGSIVLSYRFHPSVMLEAIVEHRPSFAIGAITAFQALMDASGARLEAFTSLEQVYTGGAPVSPTVAETFRRRTGKQILPAYGMTETCAPTHVAPAGLPVPIDPASGTWSIGIPTSGVATRIVDDEGIDVAPNEPGELLLRGPQIMSGYWRKPAETAEALADGWMHTGDIAVMNPDGWFFLVDRKKDVIIASGFKVWPREVEEVLYSHPAVREAAVVGTSDSYRGETVKAYVSLTQGASVTPDELIAFCRGRLAAYKVPRLVEICDELPKTASGKITRATLREQAHASVPTDGESRTGPLR